MVRHNVRCVICNLFMSFEDMGYSSVRWVPKGNSFDLEPPDQEWAHLQCWTDIDEESRQLIQDTSCEHPFIADSGEWFHAYCIEETQTENAYVV